MGFDSFLINSFWWHHHSLDSNWWTVEFIQSRRKVSKQANDAKYGVINSIVFGFQHCIYEVSAWFLNGLAILTNELMFLFFILYFTQQISRYELEYKHAPEPSTCSLMKPIYLFFFLANTSFAFAVFRIDSITRWLF